jgi:hypothetical protein
VPESDFSLCLEEGINQLQEEWLVQKRVAEIEYVQARTQADAGICYHALNNMIDGAIANDSDFAVVAGGKILQIIEWKGGALKAKIQGIRISCPHLSSVIKECIIKTLLKPHSSIEVAKFPLLEADDPIICSELLLPSDVDVDVMLSLVGFPVSVLLLSPRRYFLRSQLINFLNSIPRSERKAKSFIEHWFLHSSWDLQTQ